MARSAPIVRFVDYQPSLCPPVLLHKWGLRWNQAFGLLKDTVNEGATQATYARFVTKAPSDGLKFIGAERGFDRGPFEADDSYRTRLGNAWTSWSWAGGDKGEIDAIAVLTYTAHCIRNNQWDWDGHPGNVTYYWARHWPIIVGTGWGNEGSWGDGGAPWGDGGLWGLSGATSGQVQTLRKVVKQWTSSHALIPFILVLLSGELWGDPPGGLWGDPGSWGGVLAQLEGW